MSNFDFMFPLYEVFKYNGNTFTIYSYGMEDSITIRFTYNSTSKVSEEEFKSKGYMIKIIILILEKYPKIKNRTNKIYAFYDLYDKLTYKSYIYYYKFTEQELKDYLRRILEDSGSIFIEEE